MKKIYIQLLFLLSNSGIILAQQNFLAYTKGVAPLVDSTHSPIEHIEKGAALYVESHKSNHGFYKVVHLESNKRGLIHSENIKIHKEIPVSSIESAKSLIKKSDLKDPIVNISNSSRHPLYVTISKTEFEIKPHEQKTLKLKKGRCYFRVAAENMEPHYDVERLEDYHMYDWDFYVEEDHLL